MRRSDRLSNTVYPRTYGEHLKAQIISLRIIRFIPVLTGNTAAESSCAIS
ncbi:protein of unknown function [Xenorhabdus nematophila AN6/1]|nr:protein of unknown function [Xenorhabdus nematophila AN6/1]